MATNYPIPPYSPQTEFFCTLYGAFSPQEVQKIIDTIETQEFRKGTIGRDTVDTGVRESEVVFVEYNDEETRWIFERMAGILARVNYDKFGLDLDVIEVLQYTKYDKNGHYDWHIDSHQGEERPHQRKLSVSVVLQNAEEGGDLMLNNNGNQENPTRLRTDKNEPIPAGAAVVFYSHMPHRVDPVTKGTRLSLVAWALGPKLR